jgi:hypothetical protein
MARTEVPVTSLAGLPAGVAIPAEVPSDFVNKNILSNLHDGMWLEATNTHATLTRTITFITPGDVGGRLIADDIITMAALEKRRFGPFDRRAYGTSLQIDCSVDGAITMRGWQVAPGY